jgi:hypothetical protein
VFELKVPIDECTAGAVLIPAATAAINERVILWLNSARDLSNVYLRHRPRFYVRVFRKKNVQHLRSKLTNNFRMYCPILAL